MSKVKVIFLHPDKNIDERTVGPKAASLFRLMQIGLTTPPGFCVTEAAFREHLQANKLTTQIEASLEELAKTNPQASRSVLSNLRQAIIKAPLADTVRADIKNHYRMLSADRLAVRSSATIEDLPDHSFAGQYETYLGVAGLDGCMNAIKKCWASLWTQRAYDYRQKNGFDHLNVNMAVIVQSLVEADASGVIFTADPVNGYKSRIIIETVPGLGDSLVSGKVTPDRFIIRKRNLKIISRRIQNRKIEFVFDKTGSMKKNADENNKMCGPCIDNRIAKKLAKLARKTEGKFGCPQDIEWAISDNKIFFLQSRPITVIPLKKSWEDRQVWTNANVGEVAPDAVTDMTWSIMQKMFYPLFDSTFRLLGVELGDYPLAGLVAGRIYFNINTIVGVAQHLPEKWNLKLNDSFGGEQGKMYELGKLDIPDEDIPNLKFSLTKMIFMLPRSIYDVLSHTQKKGEVFLKDMRVKNDQLIKLDISHMSEDELAQHITSAVEDTLRSWDLMYVLTGLFAFPFLYKVCRKWFGDKGFNYANRLLAGMGDMDSAQAGIELWQLAVKARESTEVATVLLSDGNWNTIKEKISRLHRGDEFLKNWEKFMVRHGHHCRGELELSNPRWSETPNYILGILRNYIRCTDQAYPLDNYNKLAQQREQLGNQCHQELKSLIKRFIFNYFLRKAQKGSILRENWKSEAARYMAVLRRMLIELSQRLNNRGVLENQDDIFFLGLEEIEPVTQSKANFDVKETITSRRAEYEKNKSITPPKVVIGKFNPDDYTPDAVDTNAEVLNGLAVSSGVVTGKARVILKADTDGQVLPGEILVAPFTDPGWTPYFIPAAAIVMDIGGMLSHGSIIAREYGIPAVVNVGPATKIIKTGQTIQVDANRGVVTISPQTPTSVNNQST